jgi:hypothetical protein
MTKPASPAAREIEVAARATMAALGHEIGAFHPRGDRKGPPSSFRLARCKRCDEVVLYTTNSITSTEAQFVAPTEKCSGHKPGY